MGIEEVMKRHLGQGAKLRLKREDGTYDEIVIKPLTVEYLPEFWQLIARLGQVSDLERVKPQEILQSFDKEAIELAVKLIKVSLRRSYGKLDEKLLNEFVASHFMELLIKLFEANVPKEVEIPEIKTR